MALRICLLVLVAVASSRQDALNDGAVVELDSGSLKGFKMVSRSGRDYNAFTKIPYAKPPVGPLRFKKADPNVKWEGVLEANERLPDCLQIPVYDPNMKDKTIGSEDCLYLSVFSPKVGSKESDLPVMVFIHGGGWRSELPAQGPASRANFLMDEDIVLVLIHYRLGALGFLSTEDEALPGNLGLKDQSEAIHWVSKNIAKFGGDPKKITLFGNSAGGASTHYHLISPLTKDLIQGGISQSGVATNPWAFAAPGVVSELTRRVSKHLGCPEQPSEELVPCLMNKSAIDITQAESIFTIRDYDPVIPYPPVLEKGPDAFLPDSPYNLKVTKPWIVGITSEDGAFKTMFFELFPELEKTFYENEINLLPNILMFANATEDAHGVSSEIAKFYENHENPKGSLTNLFTDGYFYYGASQALTKSDADVYLYLLSYRGKTSSVDILTKQFGKDVGNLGVSHTDELLYLFDFQDIMTGPDMFTESDHEVSKRIVKTWTDFAKHGYPKSNEGWKPYTQETKLYLKISKEDTVESDLWPSRTKFWSNLPVRSKLTKLNL